MGLMIFNFSIQHIVVFITILKSSRMIYYCIFRRFDSVEPWKVSTPSVCGNPTFLAAVYNDYPTAIDIPGWNCGPTFFTREALCNFA